MSSFWDLRFAESEFAYGTEPNEFFRDQLKDLRPGRILLPAEGQGRNAVFAASIGWDVVAFDPSEVGRARALDLAQLKGVEIQYLLADYGSFKAKEESYDCIALIFAHQPMQSRKEFHQKALSWLKPGGSLILEGFSKEQLGRASGGPQDLEMLYSEGEMQTDFGSLDKLRVWKEEVILDEGKYHIGAASVIRVVGVK